MPNDWQTEALAAASIWNGVGTKFHFTNTPVADDQRIITPLLNGHSQGGFRLAYGEVRVVRALEIPSEGWFNGGNNPGWTLSIPDPSDPSKMAAALVVLNDDASKYFWSTGDWHPLQADVQGVSLHELGHALGLSHTETKSAIMYSTADWTFFAGIPRRQLDREDIVRLEGLYGPGSKTFPETGKLIFGNFWEMWLGGHAYEDSVYINGLPLTAEQDEVSSTDGKTYPTQWFERARMEYHPENQAPYDVLLGLLGTAAVQGRQNEDPFKPVPNPVGSVIYHALSAPLLRPSQQSTSLPWFPETGHTLGDASEGGQAIAAFWNNLGGLQQFGFPLSQPFMEQSQDNGNTYLVQYFERQRFEYHPENKGTRYEVLLGRLGAEQKDGTSAGTLGRLAFTSDLNGNTEIYVTNADGTQQKQLTNSPTNNQSSSWSPDGKRLVFLSGRAGTDQLYVMNADGSGQTQITTTPTGIDPSQWSIWMNLPAWSPTGQQIAFVAAGTENRGDVYTVNPDGTNLVQLTTSPAVDTYPVWSPDGSKIAFETDRNHQYDIYVMNADGTGQTRLADVGPGDTYPAWSRDGKQVAFVSYSDYAREIYVVNADGTGLTRLAGDAGDIDGPVWSPDGQRIAFVSKRDGVFNIYMMNTDGTGQTRLTSSPEDRDPVWSPDGQRIAFVSKRDGNSEIYVMNADGSRQTRLTNSADNDVGPVWSPK